MQERRVGQIEPPRRALPLKKPEKLKLFIKRDCVIVIDRTGWVEKRWPLGCVIGQAV